jgi:hypothetical protein
MRACRIGFSRGCDLPRGRCAPARQAEWRICLTRTNQPLPVTPIRRDPNKSSTRQFASLDQGEALVRSAISSGVGSIQRQPAAGTDSGGDLTYGYSLKRSTLITTTGSLPVFSAQCSTSVDSTNQNDSRETISTPTASEPASELEASNDNDPPAEQLLATGAE